MLSSIGTNPSDLSSSRATKKEGWVGGGGGEGGWGMRVGGGEITSSG